jgi:predicted protein tyrosine phosphatase
MNLKIISTEQSERSLRLQVCGLDGICNFDGHWTIFASIVDPQYSTPIVAENISWTCRLQFMFDDIIADSPGMSPPSQKMIQEWITTILNEVEREDLSILVHCHFGISRSVAAAAIAIAVVAPNEIKEIPRYLAELSPRPWPNRLMLTFADSHLGLAGKLVEAGKQTRLQTARRFPEWVEVLATTSRLPEVEELRSFL